VTEREALFSKPLTFFWLLHRNRTVTVAMISGAVKDIMFNIPEYEEEV
jgi:hypothetical protein